MQCNHRIVAAIGQAHHEVIEELARARAGRELSRVAGEAIDAVANRRGVIAQSPRAFTRDQEGMAAGFIAKLSCPADRRFENFNNFSDRQWLPGRDGGHTMPGGQRTEEMLHKSPQIIDMDDVVEQRLGIANDNLLSGCEFELWYRIRNCRAIQARPRPADESTAREARNARG